MTLNIMTPRTGERSFETCQVFLPGSCGSFEVRHNHASMVASLGRGEIRWTDGNGSRVSFAISSGVVSIDNDIIAVAAQE